MTARIIKPRKGLPLLIFALIIAGALFMFWPLSSLRPTESYDWFGLVFLSLSFLLIAILFVDIVSGYLMLKDGQLTRKTLVQTRSVKVSDIREVGGTGSGVLPTSGFSAGIELGNAKDGTVLISSLAFKKKELIPLIKQLHSELKPINPQRAKDLQKAFGRYYPDLNLQ